MWYALAVADLVEAGLFIFRLSSLPPQIPLFYSKPPGEEQLGDLWMIALLPVLMNILCIVNALLYRRYFRESIFAKHAFFYVNLFLTISLTLIFIKIIFLVS